MDDINLVALVEQFADEEKCQSYLEALRWSDGVQCPRCQSKKVYRVQNREQYDCDGCRYQFSVTAGTIFHDSHLPLWKWFLAVYLMAEAKKGISANQMKRTLNISYKTAWYLCHRIRKAMQETTPSSLSGTVEVDETFVSGKKRHVGHGYWGNKATVIGALQRGGQIRLQVIPSTDRKTLHKFIHEQTAPETEAIYPDAWQAYQGIADEDTRHETVDHNQDEWVRGDVHTNGIENVWSLLKRSIVSSYHKVSKKHLNAYLDELEWRFNNRKNPYLFRDTIRRLIEAPALTYAELTA